MHDTPAAIRLCLLGPPMLWAEGRRWPLERKDAALLTLLAERGEVARNEAAQLQWPNATAAQARTSLRQRLYRFRRTLGRDVATGANVIALAAAVEHDLGDPLPALRADPDALAGELLAGCDYGDAEVLAAWVTGARERWNQRRAEALAALAEEHEAAGALALALRYAQRMVQQEPLVEHAHRRVMRLHYRRGDRAAALAAYEHCRAVLAEQLGAAPDAETEALASLAANARTEVAVAAPPVATLRPPRLIGRSAEFARARAGLEEGRIVVVQGEAGIGKTRLLEELGAALPQTLWAGARAGDARLPLALLARLVRNGHARWPAPDAPWVREALATLLPELGPAPARLDALRLHQAVAECLAVWAAQGLQGIVIDDLHHADAASNEALLALIAARPADAGFGWLLGLRPAESPADFEAWRRSAEPGTVITLPLLPLDLNAVQELLASLGLPGLDAAAWAPTLLAHTGGNPLFILETLRTAVAQPGGLEQRLPMPSAIGALIDTRLARLTPTAMRLARVAALAGESFSAVLATEVLNCHPVDIVEPWAELERALVMRDSAFAHDLIADGVLRGIPQPVARLLHARLADALLQHAGAPAAIAHHRAGAEQWTEAGKAYVDAAARAMRSSRRAEEITLYEQAASAFENAGQREAAFDARCRAVEAVLLVRGAEAARTLTQSLVAQAGGTRDKARALVAQAQTRLMAAEPALGVADAREALLCAEAVGDAASGFDARNLLAIGLAQQDRHDEALATLEPLRADIDAQGSIEQRQRFWSNFAYVLNTSGRLRRTVDALERAMVIARTMGDHTELATLSANLATAEGNFGRPARALQHAMAARALTDPLGRTQGTTAGMIEMTIAQYCLPLGRYREGIEGLERAAAHFERDRQPLWVAVTQHHLARAFIELGQPGRAMQALSTLPLEQLQVPQVRTRRLTLQSRCRRLMGQPDLAAAEPLPAMTGGGSHHVLMLARLEEARARPEQGTPACAEVAAWAESHDHLGVLTAARLLAARCHVASRDLAAARALMPDMLERIEAHIPADMNLPEAWWTVHGVCQATGDEATAAEALRRGRHWLLRTALPEVPEPFRDSFLQRNEVHRALLAQAQRLGIA